MKREQVVNFVSEAFHFTHHLKNPGPAAVPTDVLKQVQSEMLNWNQLGMSVIEISHRSKEFADLMSRTQKNLQLLLNVPKNYKILFFHGGGTMQFSTVAMNLLTQGSVADYVITGNWSLQASKEAKRFGKVNVAVDTADQNYTSVPDVKEWKLTENAAYTYYCSNETVHGVEFYEPPDLSHLTRPGVLVSDMSSNFLSKPFDVSKFGVVFACAQKNFGVSGLAVSLVREDLIGKARSDMPSILDYKVLADSNSLKNTPPTFGIYVANLVFEWILKNGGLTAMEKTHEELSSKLYNFIDSSNFYSNPVQKQYRSRVNVICNIKSKKEKKENELLEKKFSAEAAKVGLIGVAGHRSVGGLRFSLYNAMESEGVDRLIDFMKKFEEENIDK